jgi:alpha-aminoadipic semialdehyde synthase
VRLLDYECIRAPEADGGQRLVAFGKYAGVCGMIDCFRGFGARLLAMGFSTPFMGVASSYMYPSVVDAQEAVAKMGREIARVGVPKCVDRFNARGVGVDLSLPILNRDHVCFRFFELSIVLHAASLFFVYVSTHPSRRSLSPLVFCFTGNGNVTKGALEIFKLLPHEFVAPEDLPKLAGRADRFKVYGCMVTAKDMVAPMQPGATFNKADYYANPSSYVYSYFPSDSSSSSSSSSVSSSSFSSFSSSSFSSSSYIATTIRRFPPFVRTSARSMRPIAGIAPCFTNASRPTRACSSTACTGTPSTRAC